MKLMRTYEEQSCTILSLIEVEYIFLYGTQQERLQLIKLLSDKIKIKLPIK